MISITSQAAPKPSLDIELARERLTSLLAYDSIDDLVFESRITQIIQHPLVSSIYAEPMREHYERMIEQNSQAILQYLEEGQPHKALHLFSKPYMLDGLMAMESALPDQTFWESASHVWQIVEWPSQDADTWREVLLSGRNMRECMMDEDERTKLAAMPDTLTIWRGTNTKEKMPGMSWTIDQDRAKWFANRNAMFHGGKAKVLERTISKSEVIAYLDGRGESEIIAIVN